MTVSSAVQKTHEWWKEAAIYQIYPASFKDSNGDGLGDIRGIIDKLDYIQDLGVNAVWLCPIFKSPQVDMGYDVSDYCDIHAPYGTLQDVDELIQKLHDRNMKCILDLVVNHTSDQHKWFQESKSSLDNERRDWYIWRKPQFDAAGKRMPPNNWAAAFGGSAWTYDETTEEYYLHLFAPEQPDLNWENDKVVQAVHEVMEFWLKKGADGFRMDVINFISKEPGLPDAPVTNPKKPYQEAIDLFCDGPRLHEHLRGLRAVLDKYGAFSVGEMPGAKTDEQVSKVVAADRKELHSIFQFDLVGIDSLPEGRFSGPKSWKLPEFKDIINHWQTFAHRYNGWNTVFAENHDQARTVSRFTKHRPEHRELAAKMLATCFSTLGGTLFVYQGQELGTANLPKSWGIEEYKDIESINAYHEALEAAGGDETALGVFWRELRLKARDHGRAPIQWSTEKNAGFSTAKPWMRVNEDTERCNVKQQQHDENSVLRYWSRALKVRQQLKASLVYGQFQIHDMENESIFAYSRHCDETNEHALVIINFTDDDQKWKIPESEQASIAGKLALSTYDSNATIEADGSVKLRPFEAIVLVRDL